MVNEEKLKRRCTGHNHCPKLNAQLPPTNLCLPGVAESGQTDAWRFMLGLFQTNEVGWHQFHLQHRIWWRVRGALGPPLLQLVGLERARPNNNTPQVFFQSPPTRLRCLRQPTPSEADHKKPSAPCKPPTPTSFVWHSPMHPRTHRDPDHHTTTTGVSQFSNYLVRGML